MQDGHFVIKPPGSAKGSKNPPPLQQTGSEPTDTMKWARKVAPIRNATEYSAYLLPPSMVKPCHRYFPCTPLLRQRRSALHRGQPASGAPGPRRVARRYSYYGACWSFVTENTFEPSWTHALPAHMAYATSKEATPTGCVCPPGVQVVLRPPAKQKAGWTTKISHVGSTTTVMVSIPIAANHEELVKIMATPFTITTRMPGG